MELLSPQLNHRNRSNMYFCSGFVVVDKSETLAENTLKIIKICDGMKAEYSGFDFTFFHVNGLQQISFFASLDEKNDFEEVMFNIFYHAQEHNQSSFGLAHCKDDHVSQDLMYVITFTPKGLVYRHGDPFLSPISEKLSFDGSLPFLI